MQTHISFKSVCVLSALGFLSILVAAWTADASAKSVWRLSGVPDNSQVKQWSKLPGKRSYHLTLKDPTRFELGILETLPAPISVKVVLGRFPARGDLNAWQSLAARVPLELSLSVGQMPTPSELDTLSQVGARRVELVSSRYLFEAETMHLNRVASGAGPELKELKLVIVTGSFPGHMEFPALDLLSPRYKLEFVAARTPDAVDVSWFNMIQHTIDLTLQDRWFSETATQEVRNMRRLRRVTLSTETDPTDLSAFNAWNGIPVRWIRVGRLPSDASLEKFSEKIERDPLQDEATGASMDALSIRMTDSPSLRDRDRLARLKFSATVWTPAP